VRVLAGSVVDEWESCARRAPDALQGADIAQLAPLILGSIDEKDAAVHPAMWDMLLSFARAHPAAWGAVNARKAVLPRLMALLRSLLTCVMTCPAG
jgi:hypothetical protein